MLLQFYKIETIYLLYYAAPLGVSPSQGGFANSLGPDMA